MSRRPRVPSSTTPQSTAGDPSQKSPNFPPTSNKTFPKTKRGDHERGAYKLGGKKHPTEAYGG